MFFESKALLSLRRFYLNMKQFVQYFLIVLVVSLVVLGFSKQPAINHSAMQKVVVLQGNNSGSLGHQVPAILLINSEEASSETLVENLRFPCQFLHLSRIVPRNFSFQNSICITFHLIDHSAPVPLFIWGEALLC